MKKTKRVSICIDCNKEIVCPLLLTTCWICKQCVCRLCRGMGEVTCEGCLYWGDRGIDPTKSNGILTLRFYYCPTEGESLMSCMFERFVGDLKMFMDPLDDEIRNARYVFLMSDAHQKYVSEVRHKDIGFKIDVDFYINGNEQDPDKHISILRCCNFDPDFAKVE